MMAGLDGTCTLEVPMEFIKSTEECLAHFFEACLSIARRLRANREAYHGATYHFSFKFCRDVPLFSMAKAFVAASSDIDPLADYQSFHLLIIARVARLYVGVD